MSGRAGISAPSPALLRYLRSQSETFPSLHCRPEPPPAHRKCHRHIARPPCRQLSSTACRYSGSPRSYIDDLFARNREKCTALPAPSSPHPHAHASNLNRTRHTHSDTSPTPYPRPSLWQRLFHRRRRNPAASSQQAKPLPDYSFSNSGSYEETSAQLFNLSRALSRSPAGTELKLRCTEFDKNGAVTLVSGEFKKSELIAKYGLLPRDLRKIDSSVLPHILVRPTAILINLLHLRVLIQSDRVLVFDAYGSTDSYTQSLFMYDLEGKLRPKQSSSNADLPYEFRALEAVLISVTSGLEAEFALVRDPVTLILRELEEDIDREKLRHLLIHSKKLGTFEQKARLVRDALDELLEADDDLASMYLSERKKTGKPRAETDHTEIEMLLESYHKICDEVVEISGNLISNIRNTEEVVKAILDANRNQLMLFEIKVSIATLGLAGGTLVAGFYGMNLENFIEETNWGFGAVTGFCIALSVWTCIYGLRRLRKVQKVRMWGEGSAGELGYYRRPPLGVEGAKAGSAMALAGGRGNWRSEAVEALGMAERDRRRTWFGGMPKRANANAGPVLWPGVEGLGLHKLTGVEDTNSDADDASGSGRGRDRKDGPAVTVKDDTTIGLKDRRT